MDRWCAVIVAATLGPHCLTASIAAAVEQCSRIIRRLGNFAWRERKVGRKASSAFRTVMVELEGHSPWRFRIMSYIVLLVMCVLLWVKY